MRREKYIYFIKDNVYRIKIIKKNPKINYDKYFKCDFEEIIKIRNEVLEKNNIILNEKVKKNKSILIEKYIYKTINNKYRLFIRSGNYYYSKTFATLSEAREQRKIKMSEKILINNREGKNNANIKEFVNIWFSIYCFKELKTTTSYSMMNTLNKYVLKELGNEQISNITPFKLQNYFSNLKSKYIDISDKTIYRIYKVMKNMFNRAVDWGYISDNPINKVKIKKAKSKETLIYSCEELIEILSLLKKEDIVFNAIFSLIITTGIRKCELLGLNVEDINFINGSITINKNVIWNKFKHEYEITLPKTPYSYRTIPLPKEVLKVLKEYLLHREKIVKQGVSSLFVNKNGYLIGFSYLSNSWKKFTNKNNLKYITIHGLRHSYCSIQMNFNSKLVATDIKKLMGHSQLETTFHYAHANQTKFQEAISVFDKYYNANGERKIGFNQMLSLYTKKKFTLTKEIKDLLKFIFNSSNSDDYNQNLIKDYIDKKYPIFKKIDISNINMDNVWDWLEEQKEKYGNEFIIISLV